MCEHFCPGDKLIHRSLGDVTFTEACFLLMLKHGDSASVFVEHDGDIKEVSIALVKKVSNV